MKTLYQYLMSTAIFAAFLLFIYGFHLVVLFHPGLFLGILFAALAIGFIAMIKETLFVEPHTLDGGDDQNE